MNTATLTTLALLFLCLSQAPSVAQAQEITWGTVDRDEPAAASLYGAGGSSLSLTSLEQLETTARSPGVTLHRTGTALMALGTTTLVAGALGGFAGLIIPFGCNGDFCGLSSTSMALFTTGMVTGSLGLVSFFIGLGLDIRGRIDRGRPRPIAFTPDGFAVTF